MPKIDLDAVPVRTTTGYPPPHDGIVAGRSNQRLADKLSDFKVTLTTLAPGAASSQRHWHSHEDEFIFMLAGEAVLIEDGGETVLRSGDAAVFPAGVADGHHLVNRGAAVARFLAVGPDKPDVDVCTYPDIGMTYDGKRGYVLREQQDG